MTHHLDDQVLSDLLDDALDASARARAEEHLAACDTCFSRLQGMRVLVAHASSLPRTIPAPAGEWLRVRARLGAHGSHVAPMHPWWTRRSALLAAGLALVIASSAVTALFVGGGRDIAVQPEPLPARTAAVMPRLAALEHEYATVTRDLERELAMRKHTLAPETIAAVERSLRTIDAAIAEAREALARDPGSETVARLLVAGHDQKVELLRHATRLATQS
jgi:anti-sigma factor RsiW